MMHYFKYHGLGNDYLIIDPADVDGDLTVSQIRRICHRNFGLGSDGILFGPLPHREASAFSVRIFNPDGSEAEKSGNGLRIFARYLFDHGLVSDRPFTIGTMGGDVTARILEHGKTVSVEMGRVSFDSRDIPVTGAHREVLNESLTVAGTDLTYCAATIGNPHCVVLREKLSVDELRRLGSDIEHHPIFPNRTNVQFVQVIDRHTVRIEIWERGAGYTLASGSSASAAAAVVHRLKFCDADVSVQMPGGHLDIRIQPDFSIFLTGPVSRIAEGMLHPELFSQKWPEALS